MPTPYRSLLLTLLPLVGCADTACMSLDEGETECPSAAEVDLDRLSPATCGAEILGVTGEATPVDHCPGMKADLGSDSGADAISGCEYPVSINPPAQECIYGRPLVVAGHARVASLVRGGGWASERGAGGAGNPDRAATWARVALEEHASVASFSRFALELMSLGAPAELVADAHAAALDEVRHAKLAFGLAEAAGGTALRPGPLPLGDLTLCAELVSFAEATAREGCVGETLAALQMAAAHARATDPAERAALAVIARDEVRHAALAWRTLRWALDVGGDDVRVAVTRVLARAPILPAEPGGLLSPDEACEVIGRGWREVVAPAAAALLGAATELRAHA